MAPKLYWGKEINVWFDSGLCLHAAECLRALPDVFDVGRQPWVLPDAGDPWEVAQAVRRCPTGALQFAFTREYRPPEEGGIPTSIIAKSDGPLWVRGDFQVTTDDAVTHQTRIALCRCGQSGNAPFCDASGPCNGWRPPRRPTEGATGPAS
jgi:uncharacterized Fe-S cluster protein YjdI